MDVKDTNPKDAVGIAKMPLSVIPGPVLGELGLALLEGARKYGRHNWRAAKARASVYYDAAGRHLLAWYEGEDIDPDSGLNHITKAIASLTVLRDAMIQDKWVDDRPPPTELGWLAELNAKAKVVLEKYPDCVEPWTRTRIEGLSGVDPEQMHQNEVKLKELFTLCKMPGCSTGISNDKGFCLTHLQQRTGI